MGVTHAIIIGISKYTDEKDIIPFARPSAEKLKGVLEKHYVFDSVSIFPESDAKKELGKKGIRKALKRLKNLSNDDAALIVFCGHGIRLGNNWYFLPQDISRNDADYENSFSGYELILEFMMNVPVGHIFLIVDSCYGGILARYGKVPPTRSAKVVSSVKRDDNVIKELMSPERPSRHFFAAGDAEQEVSDGGGNNSSVFMEEICNYLKNYPDAVLPASKLASEVRDKVLIRLSFAQNKQNPIFEHVGENLGGEFCFVRKGARPVKKSMDSPGDILSLMLKQKGFSVDEHCRTLCSTIAETEQDEDYDRIVKTLSHMVECIAHYPQTDIPALYYSHAICEAMRHFDKCGYFDGVYCLLDILYDLVFRDSKGDSAKSDLGKGLFLLIRASGERKNRSSEVQQWLLHLRRLASLHKSHTNELWNETRNFPSARKDFPSPAKSKIPLSKHCEGILFDLRRLTHFAFPANGGAWTKWEIEGLYRTIAFTNKSAYGESEREDLRSLRDALTEAFMQSVNKCFNNSKGEIDPKEMKNSSARDAFILDLTSRIHCVCDELSQYRSNVKMLEEVLRPSIQESLEEEIIPEKGFLFTELAYWSVIRAITGGITRLPLDLDLLSAAFCADDTSVSLLLTAGADINAIDGNGKTALMVAVHKNHTDTVQLLIGKGADISVEDKDGETALMKAAAQGYMDIVEFLLRSGANVNARDESEHTTDMRRAIIKAVRGGHVEIASALLENVADLNAADWAGSTVLLEVVEKGYADIAMMLLANGADVNARNNSGATPLIVAPMGGSFEIVTALLDHGAEVNARSDKGKTSLLVAGGYNSTVILRILLDHGAEVNVEDDFGWTPLMRAASAGLTEIAEMLLAAGADMNTSMVDGLTPLIWAAKKGHLNMARVLLENGPEVDLRDKYGETALFKAARKCHIDIVRILLDKHADVNAKNNNGSTVLMEAFSPIIPILIANGADVNLKSNDGTTALMQASSLGSIETVKLLLKKHAAVNAISDKGQTALMIAKKNENTEVAKLLKEAGAKGQG